MSDYEQRLAAARDALPRLREPGTGRLPGHVVDQIGAASHDAHGLSHRLAATLRLLEPGRGWRETCGYTATPTDIEARILVALLDVRTVCPHLRRAAPQPAWARLALHRLDCSRCLHTRRHPPPGEDDRCDWCGGRGVEVFTSVAFQRGPMLVLGDACDACAAQLLEVAA
ncbi:MAG: hypothetical protein ACRDYV_00120 [Acidimicrobiia bacterium]